MAGDLVTARIYLDSNATTPMHPDVLAVVQDAMRDLFGNASSVHQDGQRSRQALENARETVARSIGATARELLFTSGGTESNNAAIFGTADGDRRFHIVTAGIEHPSVMQPLRELERRGHRLTVVPPDRDGVVPADRVKDAITPDTGLVCLMAANNETGVMQPVAEVGSFCRERAIHFHCDAVQAAGKVAVDVTTIGCDTLSISAHKLHGPKGIGALFVRKGLTLAPLLYGGAQERRRRGGTESVPLAAGFAAAASLPSASGSILALRDRFEATLRASGVAMVVNGESAARLPNSSNITFAGADAEGLVIGLDLEGVSVSTGSACSSGRIEPSDTLLAMGLTAQEARSTVRFSLSRFNTPEEVDCVVSLLVRLVARQR